MMTFAPGTSSSFSPATASVTASAIRSDRSGSFTVSCEPIRTPGIEPTSSHAVAWRSTLPRDEVPEPGDPEQRGRVEDVRPDDLGGRQREHGEHGEREERARADGREPDHEAAEQADHDGDDPVVPGEQERPVVALRAYVGLDEEADAARRRGRRRGSPGRRPRSRRRSVCLSHVASPTPTSDAGAEPSSIQSVSRA